MAEHGVCFLVIFGGVADGIDVDAQELGDFLHVAIGLGQELVQGRIEETDGDRPVLHDGEDVDEVAALKRKEPGEGLAALVFVFGQDHGADMVDASFLEEHVLGAAEADALAAELERGFAVHDGVRVRANAEGAVLVGPLHQRGEFAGEGGLAELGLAEDHVARVCVEGDPIAVADVPSIHAEEFFFRLNVEGAAAGDAAFTHLAGDDGGMRGESAAGRENTLRDVHPQDVLRARLLAHQDDGLARFRLGDGLVGREDDLPDRGARRGGQPRREDLEVPVGVDGRVEELVEAVRVHARDRRALVDEALVHQLEGDSDGGRGRALSVAGLEHEDLAVLDGELHVLHVFVVILQPRANLLEFGKAIRHALVQNGDGLRRADPGDDVLALRVEEDLSVERLFPRRGVARGRAPRCTIAAPVAVPHSCGML